MDAQDSHGNSVAAWTAVAILLVGFALMALAVLLWTLPLFIAGVVVLVLGVIAGKVLSMAGYGVNASRAAAIEEKDLAEQAQPERAAEVEGQVTSTPEPQAE